ncbi:MAG: 50S ribosomal protein L13 [bacterium]|nr:50S ribosomal protein L13 [bacterium]
MTTRFQTKEEANKSRAWIHIDAADIPLGRLASQVASIIRGKNKPTFSPHVDCGDFVIITNAEKVKLTGEKMSGKQYIWHTTFMGGLKKKSAEDMLSAHPERLIKKAVEGMIPAGALGNSVSLKLKIYKGTEHPHKAQMPEQIKVKY